MIRVGNNFKSELARRSKEAGSSIVSLLVRFNSMLSAS